MGFVKSGVQDGTIATEAQPPARPSAIPAHYIFDTKSELWMPPSAVKKAEEEAEASVSAPKSEIKVIRASDTQRAGRQGVLCFG